MFKHYTIEEVAIELSYKNYYSTVAYGFIKEAVEKAKRDLEYTFIYESDIDVIDAYIRENYIQKCVFPWIGGKVNENVLYKVYES